LLRKVMLAESRPSFCWEIQKIAHAISTMHTLVIQLGRLGDVIQTTPCSGS
jgi:hypothetical protein